jgi:hypothetical protein
LLIVLLQGMAAGPTELVKHIMRTMKDLKRDYPTIRVLPAESLFHLFKDGNFAFQFHTDSVDRIPLLVGHTAESTTINLEVVNWPPFVKQVQYAPDTPVLADKGMVLYKKREVVNGFVKAVLITNQQFVMKALAPVNERLALIVQVEHAEQLKPLVALLLDARRRDENFRLFRRDLAQLNEDYPGVWSNPQPETDGLVEWYSAMLVLPKNGMKVHAQCTQGEPYLEVFVFGWDEYIKVVKKLRGEDVPQDAGLVAVRTGPSDMGVEDKVEFLAGGVLVSRGRFQPSRLTLHVYDKEFRSLVDILLNVLPRAD